MHRLLRHFSSLSKFNQFLSHIFSYQTFLPSNNFLMSCFIIKSQKLYSNMSHHPRPYYLFYLTRYSSIYIPLGWYSLALQQCCAASSYPNSRGTKQIENIRILLHKPLLKFSLWSSVRQISSGQWSDMSLQLTHIGIIKNHAVGTLFQRGSELNHHRGWIAWSY